MRIESHELISRHTGRTMPVRRYGRSGLPLVYVPSSGGDETEFARDGMSGVCAPWVEEGRLQVFSIDGCGPRTMFDEGLAPSRRIRTYAAFERHLAREFLPWLARLTSRRRVAVLGPSYGAFVAANLLFKYPERIDVACGLGGVYGLWHRLDGFHDDEVYFHTPLEYLPRLTDRRILDDLGTPATRRRFGHVAGLVTDAMRLILLRASIRRRAGGHPLRAPQGMSTVEPVVLRASRSACACAASRSA